MCGSGTPVSRLQAAGTLHSLGKSKWLSVGEDLAKLPVPDFEKVLHAFRLIRRARDIERGQESAVRRRSSASR